jgi:Spy/CpxP family protein refolding chaperone
MTINKTFLAASMAALGLLGQPILSHADADARPAMPAHGCDHPRQGMEGRGLERMARFLDLSAEQQQALKAIEAKYGPEMRELRQLSFDNHKALDKMDASDPRLQELAAAQGKTMADMTVLHKQMRAQMDKVLTPAQRQKMQDRFEQRRHHRGHPDGGRQEGMGPT